MSNMQATARVLVGLAVLLGGSGSLAALEVHKCVGADGRVAFQDRPCAQGETATLVRLPEAPKSVVEGEAGSEARPGFEAEPEPEPKVENPPPAAKSAPTPLDPVQPVEPAVPPALVCVREDGSRYLGEDGHGERRAVPLGALGIPSAALADAYGGPNGIGVSAPGLRETPRDRSPRGSAGALMVWVEDPCRLESGSALCSFYAERVESLQRRLRLAFSDEAPGIRTELDGWQRRAAPCRN